MKKKVRKAIVIKNLLLKLSAYLILTLLCILLSSLIVTIFLGSILNGLKVLELERYQVAVFTLTNLLTFYLLLEQTTLGKLFNFLDRFLKLKVMVEVRVSEK